MIGERIGQIVQRTLNGDGRLPPTEICNEGWMLRLCLDAKEQVKSTHLAKSFPFHSNWYSEALLPSAFLPRFRGDAHAEGFTHADAVLGDFVVGGNGVGDIALSPNSHTFLVVEAKMLSPLSKGTTHAPNYDQATRTIGCMAQMICDAGKTVSDIGQLGFAVVAPLRQIEGGVFGELVSRDSIKATMKRRIDGYPVDKTEWYQEWFLPLVEQLELDTIPWELVVESIVGEAPEVGAALRDFYSKCLAFNHPYENRKGRVTDSEC